MHAIGLEMGKGLVSKDLPKPEIRRDDEVLYRTLEVGICGSDRSVIQYDRNDPPPGETFMALGHEGLAVVEAVGRGVKSLKTGDLVVPTVRRGCGKCASCANQQSDMCATGEYRERGLHKLHGFLAEYAVDSEEYLVRVPPDLRDLAVLAEPLSIAEKVMQTIDFVQQRFPWACPVDERQRRGPDEWGYCRTALVFGAGPIGFLVACLLRKAAVRTFVLENKDETNPRVALIRALGADYVDSRGVTPQEIPDKLGPLDIIVEATGVSDYALQLIPAVSRNGVYVFTGVPRGGGSQVTLDGNLVLRQIVRMNQIIAGVVNSNRSHFEAAIADLAALKRKFPSVMGQVIGSRIPVRDFAAAAAALTAKDREKIKVVLTF